jgi:hypothetical protein
MFSRKDAKGKGAEEQEKLPKFCLSQFFIGICKIG